MKLDLLIPPPIVALVSAILIWLIGNQMPAVTYKSDALSWLGAGVIAVGFMFDVTAIVGFFKRKTTVNPMKPNNSNHLVVSGIYKITRNPMYLGLVIILLGYSIRVGTPVGLAVILCFMSYITRFQIIPEERILEEKFGEEFLSYQNRVRRWI